MVWWRPLGDQILDELSRTTFLSGLVGCTLLVLLLALFVHRRERALCDSDEEQRHQQRGLFFPGITASLYDATKPTDVVVHRRNGRGDEEDEDDGWQRRIRKQSRIVSANTTPDSGSRRLDDARTSTAAAAAASAAAVASSSPSSAILGPAWASLPRPLPASVAFTVPRMARTDSSMFSSLHHSQFDRELYTSTVAGSESSYERHHRSDTRAGCGSLKLALAYDAPLALLTVHLVHACELVSRRADGDPNPYFTVAMDVPPPPPPLPKIGQPKMHLAVASDEEKRRERGDKRKTKIAESTASPHVDEKFYFQVNPIQLSACRLEVMCFDHDKFAADDECVGYCSLTLGRVSVSTDPAVPTVIWAEVLPMDDANDEGFGELLCSISYLVPAQRLTVTILKARNLGAIEGQTPAYSIRAVLSGLNPGNQQHQQQQQQIKTKRKRTAVRKGNRHPVFNEALTFGVAKSSLCELKLSLDVQLENNSWFSSATSGSGTAGGGGKSVGVLDLPLHACRDLWRAIIAAEPVPARWYALHEPPLGQQAFRLGRSMSLGRPRK